MSERDTRIPEEENGIAVGEMDADYDEGDEVPGALDTTEITTSFEATWRHNTGEIYKGTSSAIYEGLGNAITAVSRARKMFDAWDAGVFVRIEERNEGEVYLTIRDEGIGMTKKFIDTVLSDIGTTTGLVGEASNSKFGRGFFALYMLVGESRKDASGSFVMSTNPRLDVDSEEEDIQPPYNVIFRPGELSYVKTHSAALDDNEYGTRLRFCVRDGVTADDIEKWVRDYGDYSRTPIMLERINPDGSMENDELGGRKIEHKYEDSTTVVVEEEGLYRAVASPEAEGKVVILDAQTDTSSSMSFSLYEDWNIDIRLLSEDGPIYDSPDESKIGKIPIDEEEIKDVPAGKRERYIRREEYDEYHDNRLDEPSGTRDIIELSDEFLKQVSTQLEQKLINRIKDALSNLSSPSDWENLSENQSNLIGSIISRRTHKWNINSLIDSDTKKLLRNLSRSVSVIKEGSTINNPKKISSHNKETRRAYEIQEEYDEVYYGHSILQRRADAVWSDGNNAVIKSKPKRYDSYENLGWTKITDVTSRSVEDMDVEDDVVQEFKRVYQTEGKTDSSVADNYDDRELTIHYQNYSKTINTTVGQIRDHFGDNPDNYESNLSSVGRIVAFTSTSEHSISTNKDITDNYTATCNCVNSVFEKKLSHLDNVFKYEDYANHGRNYTILTSEGNMTVSELSGKDFRFLSLSEGWKNKIRQMQEESDVNVISNLLKSVDTVAVVTKYDLHAIRPQIDVLSPEVRQNGYSTQRTFRISQPTNKVSLNFTEQVDGWERLVKSRLPKWNKKDEMKCIINSYSDEMKEVQEKVLETYGEMHDQGLEPSSEKNTDIGSNSILEMSLNTNIGEMSVREIKNSDFDFVAVPVTDTVKEVMEEVPIEVVEEYINNNVSTRNRYYRKSPVFNKGGFVVAMVDYETAEKLTENMKVYTVRPSKSPTLSGVKRSRRPCRYYTEFYGYYKSKESNVDRDIIMPATSTRLVPEGYHFIKTLVDIHDSSS